jgi:hypothetical protein
MCPLSAWLKALRHLIQTAFRVLLDFLRLILMTCRFRSVVEAENLFLRKQLALFQERKNKAHRADDSTRWLLSFLSRWFDWRNALAVVQPETLIRWHRKGFRLFWRWKSRPVGRPRLPKDVQALIRQMARENPTWGAEHIANELKLKLGNSIFSQELDQGVAGLGVRVLRTLRRAPQANAVCERLVGTIRRECLDFLIPLGERHLKHILNRWVGHYNHGRVHMSLGPGIPAPLYPSPPQTEDRHRLPHGHRVRRKAVRGLHHEYWLEKVAA